jgi:hypothetical protein
MAHSAARQPPRFKSLSWSFFEALQRQGVGLEQDVDGGDRAQLERNWGSAEQTRAADRSAPGSAASAASL